jgi:hypothetical protein
MGFAQVAPVGVHMGGGLSTWWQQEIGSGHSTWALTVHVRHRMCVRCKELVCPCTPVLGISVKANDHPPPITSHICSAWLPMGVCVCRGVRAVAGGEGGKGRGWWAPSLDVYMLQVVNGWLCSQPQQQRRAITAEHRAPIPEHPGS